MLKDLDPARLSPIERQEVDVVVNRFRNLATITSVKFIDALAELGYSRKSTARFVAIIIATEHGDPRRSREVFRPGRVFRIGRTEQYPIDKAR